jgi:hypothetical protein
MKWRNEVSHELDGKSRSNPKGARLATAGEQRSERRRSRGNVDPAHWHEADSKFLHAVVCNLTESGCAVQFGLTKDGGAYVVRIIGDGEPYNEYVRPTEDVNLYLDALATDFSKTKGE